MKMFIVNKIITERDLVSEGVMVREGSLVALQQALVLV